MERKAALGRVELKDADLGTVTAVFSKFDVIDKDGDVTAKGAIKDGTPVVISAYNHQSWGGALPVGKGHVRIIGDEAVLDGQFFLNTTHGRDTFETVKQLAESGLGEWSYGFHPVKSEPSEMNGKSVRLLKELDVHEVSPVMMGAGNHTRTTGVKSLKFSEEGEAVLTAVTKLRERAAEVMAKRAEKGKGLGEESETLVKQIRDQLAQLESLLDTTPESPAVDNSDAESLWLSSIASEL